MTFPAGRAAPFTASRSSAPAAQTVATAGELARFGASRCRVFWYSASAGVDAEVNGKFPCGAIRPSSVGSLEMESMMARLMPMYCGL